MKPLKKNADYTDSDVHGWDFSVTSSKVKLVDNRKKAVLKICVKYKESWKELKNVE